MTNEELNTALYKKVFAEQEKYREWLLSQPPDEILNHCYEYTVREDIVLALEEYDLSDKQCKALLKSPCPLADVFKDFEKRETDHMLDNRYALLFIRGERPIRDLKYDILHHPNVALTTDGSAPAYTHGEDTRSIASMAFSFDKKAVKNAATMEAEKHEFLLYSEEELEELLDEKEKKDNEEA